MWLHVTKVVSVTLMLAITCVAIAQEPTRAELPYLVEYDKSPDLPNGIAFYMTLLTLDHFHTESGGVDFAAWVAQELELSNVDSHSFVSQALTTLYLMNIDVTTQLARHSCQFAGAKVSKKNKYAALQQTYDIQKAKYRLAEIDERERLFFEQVASQLSAEQVGYLFEQYQRDSYFRADALERQRRARADENAEIFPLHFPMRSCSMPPQ